MIPLTKLDRRERARAFRWVGFQATAAVALALVGLLFQPQAALSLLMGGLIGVAGSGWLAYVAFRSSATSPAKEILVSFYLGEIGRFLIVMILFVVAFKQAALLKEPGNALMLFLAFVVSQVAVVFAPTVMKRG